MDGAWEGKEERAHGLTGPKTNDSHQKKSFYLVTSVKRFFSFLFQPLLAKSLKTLNPKFLGGACLSPVGRTSTVPFTGTLPDNNNLDGCAQTRENHNST